MWVGWKREEGWERMGRGRNEEWEGRVTKGGRMGKGGKREE